MEPITRTQVTAALEALGIDPNDTRSVTITPTGVWVEAVTRDADEAAVIEHGQLQYTHTQHDIEENADA